MKRIFLIATIFVFYVLFFGKSVYSETDTYIFEKELLKYINDYRAKHNRSRLVFDKLLNDLAKDYSQFMHKNNILSHSNFNKRFNMSGRNLCVENVGWNWHTPESQFEAWKESKNHRTAMLHEDIKVVGISRVGLYVTFFACK